MFFAAGQDTEPLAGSPRSVVSIREEEAGYHHRPGFSQQNATGRKLLKINPRRARGSIRWWESLCEEDKTRLVIPVLALTPDFVVPYTRRVLVTS